MSTTNLTHAARRLLARLSGNRRVRDRLEAVTQPAQHSAAGWKDVQRRPQHAAEEREG